MSRLLALVSSALLLVLAGCAADPDASKKADSGASSTVTLSPDGEGSVGTIEGTVVDEEQRPVEGAQVALLDAGVPLVAETNADGGFALANVPVGVHKIGVQKVGYDQVVRSVEVIDGETATLEFTLIGVPSPDESYYTMLTGEGYIACGAYLLVTSVSNANACAWDSKHKPRYEFLAPKVGLKGVLQEIVWEPTSAAAATKLEVHLEYKPVCDPTCSAEKSFKATVGESPIRQYSALDKQGLPEAEIPLSSSTFVDGDDLPVIVYQQSITHYITIFYGVHGSADTFTAIPPK